VEVASTPAAAPQRAGAPPPPSINVIPDNGKWANGIPPVMGAHLMASGSVAPISTSTGCGTGVKHVFQYHEAEGEGVIMQYGNAAQICSALAKKIAAASAEAVAERGAFTLVLSGGSLPSLLADLAAQKGVEFDKWTVLFVDERNVSHANPDSNYKAAKEAILARCGVPEAQIIKIGEDLPVAQAATAYAGDMMRLPRSVLPRDADDLPVLDMILLGVGPDGHVGSLFPNTAATACDDGSWVVPVSASPKPPAERITMTMPVINAAKEVLIVAVGEGKAEIVQRALETQSLPGALPVQLVYPKNGQLTWVVDAAACSLLQPLEWEKKKAWPRSQI